MKGRDVEDRWANSNHCSGCVRGGVSACTPQFSNSTVTTDVELPLHSCFTCPQPCHTHLIILPSHMRWLKTHLKSAHSRSHPVVRQDNFAIVVRHYSFPLFWCHSFFLSFGVILFFCWCYSSPFFLVLFFLFLWCYVPSFSFLVLFFLPFFWCYSSPFFLVLFSPFWDVIFPLFLVVFFPLLFFLVLFFSFFVLSFFRTPTKGPGAMNLH